MGWSVHASVDDQHLHLKPVAFLRWFGAIPMSIRWEHLSKLNRSGKSAYITGGRLVSPAWCFEMLKARTTDARLSQGPEVFLVTIQDIGNPLTIGLDLRQWLDAITGGACLWARC